MSVLLYLIVLINLSVSSLTTDLFNTWCEKHGKSYSSEEEKFFRLRVFEDNLAFVTEHNRMKNSTYTLALNDFADLTHLEFKTSWLGLKLPPLGVQSVKELSMPLRSSRIVHKIPSSIDWRTKGAVTSVKNQASCGASWAFSAIGAIEGIHKIATGSLVSLSEQELLDCEKSYSSGCSGGLMDTAFQWAIESHGIGTKEDYPYQAGERTCNMKVIFVSDTTALHKFCLLKRSIITIDGYTSVPRNDEEQLLHAIASQPVSAGISASERAFQFYSKGIFSGSCSSSLDHAVLIVGYSSENRTDYLILKNSWGRNWGLNGYMHIQRNSGNQEGVCGINILASYPIKTSSKLAVPMSKLRANCDLLRYCKEGETCCCSKRFIICLSWICCMWTNPVCCKGHCCATGYLCDARTGDCYEVCLCPFSLALLLVLSS
ncbi:hypothetical protein IFM89_005805 [Coptis chinensis]|uniref:Uncharacterized protein n=1 Tax=Coptis chinensis TaxID=261450 RepID=A0A835IK40_9MAGN|nr:hypothetical protein IFM89_005805 [Coptis chinensis]